MALEQSKQASDSDRSGSAVVDSGWIPGGDELNDMSGDTSRDAGLGPPHPLAIASVVTGGASVCVGPLGPVAIVLGVLALRSMPPPRRPLRPPNPPCPHSPPHAPHGCEAAGRLGSNVRRSGHSSPATQTRNYGGRGQAIAGIALGAIGLIVMILALGLLMVVYSLWGQAAIASGQPVQSPVVQGAVHDEVISPPQAKNVAGASQITGHYYYDLNTGQLFVTSTGEFPPIDAPSGPTPQGEQAGARAFVFACGDCSDPTQRFVGYVMRRTQGAAIIQDHIYASDMDSGNIEAHLDAVFDQPFHLGHGMELASPQDLKWVSPVSSEGKRLLMAPMNSPCRFGLPARKCEP